MVATTLEGNRISCEIWKFVRLPSGDSIPKEVLSSAPDSQNRDLIGNGEKKNINKLELSYLRFALSVFDLLGDDRLSDNLERSLVNEAHVAFAVEGQLTHNLFYNSARESFTLLASGKFFKVVEFSLALQEIGSFSVVLECVLAPIAAAATFALHIPTIGIGVGPFCIGQIN
ncbi:hypothetical protein LOK49_LG03G01683 [Camellia lanceoleosa]|uniref:Uncharacterized protein n=1 Tax=Camellia lanceoleosa TaxID=1840588 RepID=A0ACC0IBR7_9ERIC|nr:hypothetical protein LOK49_LG03G01683 [Camellia lanceoleosa]